jgi:hypothetical protein
LIVKVAFFSSSTSVAATVTLIGAVTALVGISKLTDVAPAATTTLAGKFKASL